MNSSDSHHLQSPAALLWKGLWYSFQVLSPYPSVPVKRSNDSMGMSSSGPPTNACSTLCETDACNSSNCWHYRYALYLIVVQHHEKNNSVFRVRKSMIHRIKILVADVGSTNAPMFEVDCTLLLIHSTAVYSPKSHKQIAQWLKCIALYESLQGLQTPPMPSPTCFFQFFVTKSVSISFSLNVDFCFLFSTKSSAGARPAIKMYGNDGNGKSA